MTNSSGTKRRIQTTKGVILCIKWHNLNTTWVALNDIKEAYTVKISEYIVADKISMESAFAWWVPHTLKKRNNIIAKLKLKYWLKNHKFGIKAPENMKQEIDFDCDNGNTLW